MWWPVTESIYTFVLKELIAVRIVPWELIGNVNRRWQLSTNPEAPSVMFNIRSQCRWQFSDGRLEGKRCPHTIDSESSGSAAVTRQRAPVHGWSDMGLGIWTLELPHTPTQDASGRHQWWLHPRVSFPEKTWLPGRFSKYYGHYLRSRGSSTVAKTGCIYPNLLQSHTWRQHWHSSYVIENFLWIVLHHEIGCRVIHWGFK